MFFEFLEDCVWLLGNCGKLKEFDMFGGFDYLELVKYALILTRMGLRLLIF